MHPRVANRVGCRILYDVMNPLGNFSLNTKKITSYPGYRPKLPWIQAQVTLDAGEEHLMRRGTTICKVICGISVGYLAIFLP